MLKRNGLLLLMLICMGLTSVYAQEGEGENTTPIATALPPDVTPTAVPKPAPAQVFDQNGITLEFYFDEIKQGRAALLHIFGDGVVGASARFMDDVIEFFPIEGDGFYGLLAPGIEQPARDYDVTVYALLEDDSRIEFATRVSVRLGGFIKELIDIPVERAFLIDPEVERTEFARLNAIFQNVTNEVLWDSGDVDFQLPVSADITSPFGAVRVLNGTTETRHTGWDLRANMGTPVMAMAAGKVAFAGTLDIRGNIVIIEHGYGIFSAYSHFSVMNVVRGEAIAKGQIIGMSGNTGRSSGPHLHWEITVNGEWVDSVDFLRMWLP